MVIDYGAIIGSIIAGILAIIGIFLSFWLKYRYNRQHQHGQGQPLINDSDEEDLAKDTSEIPTEPTPDQGNLLRSIVN